MPAVTLRCRRCYMRLRRRADDADAFRRCYADYFHAAF